MTLTNKTGNIALEFDNVRRDGAAPTLSATPIMDATAEKIAMVGCVWHPTVSTGTINIRKIHFRCGAVTFNAASVLQVSLQTVSATAGPPYQPDGTPDQTAAITGVTGLTANALNVTGNLSADRAVDLSADSIGDANSRWLAVVFEYTTFTALDSIIISGSTGASIGSGRQLGNAMILNTGSWAVLSGQPAIIAILECDDGTFAFLEGSTPFITYSSASVASNGAIRRAGFKFRGPVEQKISKLALMISTTNGGDGRFVLYDSDGTTELRSSDMDNDAVIAAADVSFAIVVFEPVTLAANTYYRFVFVSSTATVTTVYYGDVNAAGHMDGLMWGQDLHWTQHDGSNWADTTTRRPHPGIGVCAVHDGSGSGGGGPLEGGRLVR